MNNNWWEEEFFQEVNPFEYHFKSLKELIDWLRTNLQNAGLIDIPVVVEADISHARLATNGMLFFEISENFEGRNLSMTVYVKSYRTVTLLKYYKTPSAKFFENKRWRIKGTLTFWNREAKFLINLDSMEPVGKSQIEERRRKIIEKLKKEGLVTEVIRDLHELPPIRKIAVISSETAAGYEDFMKNIKFAKNIPLVHIFHSVMQGLDVPSSVSEALKKIIKTGIKYDVVVIIRGGGAKADLMYFDDEELGRKVGIFSRKVFPVLTGIGHERDKTVLDHVAWRSFSTPTEVARAIVKQIDDYYDSIIDIENDIYVKMDYLIKRYEQILSTNAPKILRSRFDEIFKVFNQKLFERCVYIKDSVDTISKKQMRAFEEQKENTKYIKEKIDRSISDFIDRINETNIRLKSRFSDLFISLENKVDNLFNQIINKTPFLVFKSNGVFLKSKGKIVSSVNEIKSGNLVEIVFNDGEAKAKILSKKAYLGGKNVNGFRWLVNEKDNK